MNAGGQDMSGRNWRARLLIEAYTNALQEYCQGRGPLGSVDDAYRALLGAVITPPSDRLQALEDVLGIVESAQRYSCQGPAGDDEDGMEVDDDGDYIQWEEAAKAIRAMKDAK